MKDEMAEAEADGDRSPNLIDGSDGGLSVRGRWSVLLQSDGENWFLAGLIPLTNQTHACGGLWAWPRCAFKAPQPKT